MPQASPTAKSQIRTLLTVFLSGIVGAFLLAFLLVYNYGPSGQYQLRNALIEPSLASTLSYNDANDKTGNLTLFLFDGLEFVYFDESTKQEKRIPVSKEKYAKFYQLVLNDYSLLEVPETVLSLFDAQAASLLINVRTASHAEWQDQRKVFQSVAFANHGDYYRVRLHEEPATNPWVYFYHPGIYRDAFTIFVPKS